MKRDNTLHLVNCLMNSSTASHVQSQSDVSQQNFLPNVSLSVLVFLLDHLCSNMLYPDQYLCCWYIFQLFLWYGNTWALWHMCISMNSLWLWCADCPLEYTDNKLLIIVNYWRGHWWSTALCALCLLYKQKHEH